MDHEEKYFKKDSESEWIELDNGKTKYKFKFVEQIENEEVILNAEDRHFFVKLNSHGAYWGASLKDINRRFITGTWSNKYEGFAFFILFLSLLKHQLIFNDTYFKTSLEV